jgi:hypothetical protein
MTKSEFGQKAVAIPFEVLAERGFKLLPAEDARTVVPGSGLEETIRHPLNFLDDRRCGLLRFAEFEDEMVAFEREGKVFDLFAISIVGRFLFVGRADECVYQHSDWSPEGTGPTFEPINTSLLAFVKCHCMEQSIAYRMRAVTGGSEGDEGFESSTEECEAELRRFIEQVDKPALDSVYWSTVLYELGDGLYRIVPTAAELLHNGRWPVGGA